MMKLPTQATPVRGTFNNRKIRSDAGMQITASLGTIDCKTGCDILPEPTRTMCKELCDLM